ncbi:MAG: DUF6443 domain-containing protein, partial [Spirosomaceae bacterium]|nr:DUF6443 domain-containing protein [Spirosomataceae bacterium]
MRAFYLLLWLLSWGWLEVYSQAKNNRVGSVQMPSPDGASLGRYGDLPVGHFTGAMNVPVPIHTLRCGPLSADVTLSYHSSGLKVGETASWVGAGWSLQTGGFVSRTVQSIEDELLGGYMFQGSGWSESGGCVQHTNGGNPLNQVLNAQLDGEPDIFSFNAGGYNGKFYINAAGTVVQVPQSDLKISYTLNGTPSNPRNLKTFTITLPDGTQYLYGDIGDGNAAIAISRVNDSNFWSATDWKLKKIVSADDNYSISYTYEQEKYRYPMRNRNGILTANGYRYQWLEMESHRLTKMSTSCAREEINFEEGDLRQDVSDPLVGSHNCHRLGYVEVKSNATFCKKFELSYDYFQDNTAHNSGVSAMDKRLKLLSVQEKKCDNSVSIPAYTFEYFIHPDFAGDYYPTRLSAAIDHWGYFNGYFTNKNFHYNIPFTEVSYTAYGVPVYDFEGGATRVSQWQKIQIGMLNKITYPTGGHSKFEYGPNLYYGAETFKTITPYPFTFSGDACSENLINVETNPITFTDIDIAYFELEVGVSGAPGLFCCNGENGNYGNWQPFVHSNHTAIDSPVGFNANCNNNIASQTTIKGKLKDLFPSLQSGVEYHFDFNFLKTGASLKFYYIWSEQATGNLDVGGLRIAKITHHDGLNEVNDVVKTYNYDDANINGQSSGKLYNLPTYSFIYNSSSSPCSPNPTGSNIITHFWFDESNVPLYSFEGYHLGYESVKEYVSGAGYTQYTYFMEPADIPVTYPYAPPRAGVSTGQLATHSQRNGGGTALAYTVNTAQSDTYQNSTGTMVKAYWATAADNTPIGLWKSYKIQTRPFRLASVETHKDGLSLHTTHSYRGDNAHLLPVESQTTHPDGTLEKLTYQYPQDLNQTDLLAEGMTHTLLEHRRYINGSQVSGLKTNYSIYSGFPRPQTIQSWNTDLADWETDVTFDNYGAHGNPTALTQRGWLSEAYTWAGDLLTQKTYSDFEWKYDYHPNTALLQKYTEPNGLFTQYSYDGLSRPSQINRYNGKDMASFGYDYSPGSSVVDVQRQLAGGPTFTTQQEFDGLGRPISTYRIGYGFGMDNVTTRTEYDGAGRVKKTYLPGFFSTGAATTYTYEDSPLARAVSIQAPAPLGTTTLSYGNSTHQWTTTRTNPLAEINRTYTDTRGRTRKTEIGQAPLINETNYHYDERDNLLTVLPHGRDLTDTDYIYSYTYDGRNNLLTKKIPEKSPIQMVYDSRDLLTHYKDGFQPVVHSVMDDYGRVTQTGYVSGLNSSTITNTLTETFYKTTAGLGFGQPYKTMTALLDANGSPTASFITREITAFDVYHRPTHYQSNHPLSIGSATAMTGQMTYNGQDALTGINTNVTVNGTTYATQQTNTYDHSGRPTKREFGFEGSTKTVEETTAFNPLDQALTQKIGGNLQTLNYTYYPNGFLHQINDGSTGAGGIGLTANDIPNENSANDLFAMELNYAANGNINSQKIQNRGFALQNYTYTYDGLQRLIAATNGTHAQSYSYKDVLGNFSTLTRSDLVKSAGNWTLQNIDNLAYSYTNVLSSKIQSIADATNNPIGYKAPSGGTGAYQYDANGNTTYDPA